MGKPMKKVSRDASVHEKTVKEAAQQKPARRKPKRVSREPVIVRLDLRMHDPAVRAVAHSLAKGDLKRIEQVGPNDLIVHNNSNWRYLRGSTKQK
jgi:hypothetical protein